MSKQIIYRCIWIPSLLATLGMTVAFSRGPANVAEPGRLIQWEAGDKSIYLMRPDNWRPQALGSAGTSMEVWFEPANNVYFKAKADLAGSLMADISKSTGGGAGFLGESMEAMGAAGDLGGGAQEMTRERSMSPEEKLHLGDLEALQKKYQGFEESPVKQVPLGSMRAAQTTFTFKKSGMWGERKMVGKRLTALSSERRVSIFCYCPEGVREKIEPTFEKMIASFRLGEGAGQ